MLKKLLGLTLVLTMAVSLWGCSQGSENETKVTPKAEETGTENQAAETTKAPAETSKGAVNHIEGVKTVGLSLGSLGNEYFDTLANEIETFFAGNGVTVKTVSAENNAATQVQQIENLMTEGVGAIIVYPIDPDSVVDVLKRAKEAGVYVITAGTFVTDPEATDAQLGVNQPEVGKAVAQMASDWIDKTYPDAADGSISVSIIGFTANTTGVDRTNGMYTIGDINPKVKVSDIVYDLVGQTAFAAKSQEFADAMFMQEPDTKVVICYNDEAARAVSEVVKRTSEINADEIGIFAIDYSEATMEAIADPKDPVRGTILLGDLNLAKPIWQLLTGEVVADSGEWGNIYFKPTINITMDNVSDYQ